MNDFPRRIQQLQWVEAERKIADAVDEVESLGADVRLTDAVVLLGAARDRVADFVDGVEGKRTIACADESHFSVVGRPQGSGVSPEEARREHEIGYCWCGATHEKA